MPAKDASRRVYRLVRDDITRILVASKRHQRAPEINPNRHQVEQHKGNQEKHSFFVFRSHRKPDNAKVDESPNKREREQRIEDAFKEKALFIGLASVYDFFVIAHHQSQFIIHKRSLIPF
jgi:hypothetical protein